MESRQQRQKAKIASRKAKFQDFQSGLPEEERLDARRDWDEHVWRQLSYGREQLVISMTDTFVDFLTDQDLPLKLSPEAAKDYFRKGGSGVTTRVLRMFIEFMAQSRTGLHPDAHGRLKHNTVHNYINMLSTIFKRAQNPIEKEIKEAAHAWIEGYLLPKGMVTNLGKPKYTCYDISTLIRTILTPEYTATMLNTRAPLQLVLFLSLATDCSGRIGEFVATYGKRTKPTYLRWRHATITAFQTPTGVTLRGTIRFQDLKDLKGDPNKHKTIPLRLLPLEIASEDSFRLLLVLGFIDQVFESLDCWDDIQRLAPGPNGTHVRIRQAALDLPIFRAVDEHQVTESPLYYHTIHRELLRLGVYMGLEQNLLCSAIRRGAAYLLAMNCTAEERCARMGHKNGDSVYWNYYRNETSTVDFQALVHKVTAEDVASLSDIAINRRLDAPQKPSHAAYREMWQLPHIEDLRNTQLTMFDKIISTHQNMTQARVAKAVGLQEYDSVVSKYKAACETAISSIFKRELAEFFASDCPIAAKTQVIAGNTLDEQSVQIYALEQDVENHEIPRSFPASFPNPSGVISDANIDPVLLGETSSNFMKVFDEDVNKTPIDKSDSQQYSPTLSRMAQFRTGKTVLRPTSLVDSVSDNLLSGDSVLSDSELADLMIKSFNHMYPSDHFQPGQEPIAGTCKCRFCGKAFPREASRHAHWCQKEVLVNAIVKELDENYAQTDKCTWVGRRIKDAQLPEQCGKTKADFKTQLQWTRHVGSHIAVRGKNPCVECRFGECGLSEEPVIFMSFEARDRHITITHRLRTTRAQTAHGAAERMIWWCPVCLRFINQLEEDVDEHARSHIHVFNDIIHVDGYNGLEIGHLAIIPCLCIFCVHDSDKSENIRFNGWHSLKNHKEHIYQHIHKHDARTLIPCPASITTGDGITSNCSESPLSPADLEKHLHHVHGIESQKAKTRRKPDDTTQTDHMEKSDDADNDDDQPEPKKTKTQRSRRILQVRSTNIVRQATRKGTSSTNSDNCT